MKNKQIKKMLCLGLLVEQHVMISMDRVNFDHYALEKNEIVVSQKQKQTEQELLFNKKIQEKPTVVNLAKQSKNLASVDVLKSSVHLDLGKLSPASNPLIDHGDIDVQDIKNYLEKLPKKNQPSDMDQALQMVKDGAMVARSIESGRFFDAIMQNFSKDVLISDRDKTLLQNAFNLSDSDFWEIIKNDKKLALKASNHNIPFVFNSLESVENAMYFRSAYARAYSDEKILLSLKSAYQKSIIQLQWHLYSKAVLQEGQAFSSGMISLQDPNFATFKFLDGYAELISPKYKLHSSVSIHSIVTTKAYTRKSSHYVGAKRFDFDCGIDIQDNNNQPLSILPGNKSHILFGLRSNDMLFVKWENYGVTFNPLENDTSIIPHIKGYFDKKDKLDNPLLERREKLPDDVMQEFKKLYGNKKILPKEKKGISELGISYMLSMLDSKSRELFKSYLINTKKYSANSLSFRKGNEIIVSGSIVG